MGAGPDRHIEKITPDNIQVRVRPGGRIHVTGKCGQIFRVDRNDIPELVELLQEAKTWADETYKGSRQERHDLQIEQMKKQAMAPSITSEIQRVIDLQSLSPVDRLIRS